MLLCALGRLKGCRVVAQEGIFRSDEMKIMCIVHQRINALRMHNGKVNVVDTHCSDVCFLSAFMIADTDVDVRRHVHQMSGSRREPRESLRRGQGSFGMRGSLDRVNVEVICAEMARI